MTAIFSYLNYRFFKLLASIGVMLIFLLMLLTLIAAGQLAPWIHEAAVDLTKQIDFNDALIQSMLCFLLFAGSLHIDLSELADPKSVIATLAVAGVAISMFAFGALISPPTRWRSSASSKARKFLTRLAPASSCHLPMARTGPTTPQVPDS